MSVEKCICVILENVLKLFGLVEGYLNRCIYVVDLREFKFFKVVKIYKCVLESVLYLVDLIFEKLVYIYIFFLL